MGCCCSKPQDNNKEHGKAQVYLKKDNSDGGGPKAEGPEFERKNPIHNSDTSVNQPVPLNSTRQQDYENNWRQDGLSQEKGIPEEASGKDTKKQDKKSKGKDKGKDKKGKDKEFDKNEQSRDSPQVTSGNDNKKKSKDKGKKEKDKKADKKEKDKKEKDKKEKDKNKKDKSSNAQLVLQRLSQAKFQQDYGKSSTQLEAPDEDKKHNAQSVQQELPQDIFKQDYGKNLDQPKATDEGQARQAEKPHIEKEISSMKEQYRRVEDELNEANRNIKTLEFRVTELQRDLSRAEKEKEQALLRLSEEASKKLVHENPNITDLSDENRATKLAEKMSELYDNQWTDAYEAMCKNPKYPEKTTIQHLLKIFKTVYDVSRRMSEAQSKQLMEAIACFTGCSEKVAGTYVNLKALSDVRKINHDSATDDVEKAVMKLFKTNSIHTGVCDEALPFMKACIPLCWLMCIQEPPVVIWMDIHMGDVLDKNQVRTYTVDGDQVDYMVWPVVFLHDGGPLLAKGVVQAIPKRKDNRLNQTIDENNMRNSPKSVKNHRGSKVMSVGASGHNKDSSSKAFTEGFTIKNAEKQPILFSKKTNATGESETMVSQHERKGQTSNQGNMIKASQNGQMLKGPAPRVPIQQSTNAVPTNQELRKGPDPVRNLEHSGTQNGKPTSSGPTTHGKTGQLNVARTQVGEQGTTISGNLSAPKTDKRASSGKVLNGDKRDRDRPQPGHGQSTKSMFVGSGPSNQEERKSRNYFSQTEHSHL